VDDRFTLVAFFFPVIDVFPGTPACDMPFLVLPEDSIQEASRTQEPDVPTMERRDWPTRCVFAGMEERKRNLTVRRRFQELVFDCIQRNSIVFEDHRLGDRDFVLRIRNIGKRSQITL